MKTNRVLGIRKAIVFLYFVIYCLVSSTSCEPEIIDNKPKVVLLAAENANVTSAVLVVA